MVALVVVTLVGGLLRLWITRGLWLDEATSVEQAKMGYWQMATFMRVSDIHPLLFQSILWLDIRIFGTSEFAVRLPSLLIGIVTIPLLYGCARELYGQRTAWWAAVIAALTPSLVWYSQEARQYALFIALATVTVWSQVVAVRRNRILAWVVYTFATAALLWTQYFSSLHIFVQQLAFVAFILRHRQWSKAKVVLRNWLISLAALLVVVIPLLPIAVAQLGHARAVNAMPQEAGDHFYASLTAFISMFLGYHSDSVATDLNAFWPLWMAVAAVLIFQTKSRVTLLLLALIAFPFFVLAVASSKQSLLMELRYFAGAIPCCVLLLARCATSIQRHHVYASAVPIGALAITGSLLVNQQTDPKNARVYDYRAALKAIQADHSDSTVIVYEPAYLQPVINFYAPDVEAIPLSDAAKLKPANGVDVVGSLVFADHGKSEESFESFTNALNATRRLEDQYRGQKIQVLNYSAAD